jgi:NADPH:quinone reductase-like Zn-dependent oxidoreductase
MQAFALTGFDSAPALRELPLPEPGPGQVRIRVAAASLNEVDVEIAAGALRERAEYRFPVVLGRDGAGVVDALGDGVDGLAPGDEVLGHLLLGPALHDGTIAERALLSAGTVVARPATLAPVEAAALPLAGASALAIVEDAGIQDAERVLVAGAGGGVGSFALQLAAARGAVVVAAGEPEDVARLKSLGAHEVVDERDDVPAQVLGDGGPVDVLLDLAGGAGCEQALRGDGRVVRDVEAQPTRETLERLLELIARGTLRVDVERTVLLADAHRGLDALARGEARGKIVVRIGH